MGCSAKNLTMAQTEFTVLAITKLGKPNSTVITPFLGRVEPGRSSLKLQLLTPSTRRYLEYNGVPKWKTLPSSPCGSMVSTTPSSPKNIFGQDGALSVKYPRHVCLGVLLALFRHRERQHVRDGRISRRRLHPCFGTKLPKLVLRSGLTDFATCLMCFGFKIFGI